MPANDTLGEITSDELAELRRNAKTCTACGMVATIDPVFHAARYAHSPVIRDADGTLIWETELAMWIPHTRKCATCAAEIPAGDTHCQRCAPARRCAVSPSCDQDWPHTGPHGKR